MSYKITYRKSVAKELRKVPSSIRATLVQRILALTDDPRPNGCTKLEGSDASYRIRQGDYRVIYNIYDDLIVVEVIKIGHRSDVYRKR